MNDNDNDAAAAAAAVFVIKSPEGWLHVILMRWAQLTVECNNATSQHSTKMHGFTNGFCVAVDLTTLIPQKTSAHNIESLSSCSSCQSISAAHRLVCQSACPNNYYLSSMRAVEQSGDSDPPASRLPFIRKEFPISQLLQPAAVRRVQAKEALSHKANGMSRWTLVQRRPTAAELVNQTLFGHRQLTTGVPVGSRGSRYRMERKG